MLNSFIEKIVAGKWIAGPSLDDALETAKNLNKNGIVAIINFLGEEYHKKSYVDNAVERYIDVIMAIKKEKVNADIAVKMSELGLLIKKKLAEQNYKKIVDFAKKNGVFVWIDMEEYSLVSNTIDVYKKYIRSNNGLCIQSHLKRSEFDLKMLPKKAIVRLVKGAYSEKANIAYITREGTTRNYYTLMHYLFANFRKFTIATHDSAIIEKALKLNKRYKRDVTYAMLKGIRYNLALDLRKKGEKVSIYVPFGEEWIRYALRRLKEMSSLVLFVRSIFQQ